MIAIELYSVNLPLLGFISGLIPFAYSLGKILSYRVLDAIIHKLHVKWVLFFMLLGLIIANTLLSTSSSLALIIFSRFLSGLFVNLQIVVRKLLHSISLYEVVNDDIHRKALVAQRIGVIFGTFFSVFLYKTEIIVKSTPLFVGKHFLMLGGLSVLFQLSSLFLVFFVTTPISRQEKSINRYAELPEIKAVQEKDSDRQDRDIQDTSNLFNISMRHIENSLNEENLGAEEVKFYSPKNVVNREVFYKKIQSAKPQLTPMFSFPEPKAEAIEPDSYNEDRKVHISFIDEEYENEENSEEIEKAEPSLNEPVTKVKITQGSLELWYAKCLRFLFSAANGSLVEGVPALVFLQCFKNGVIFITTFEVLCLTAALGLHQVLIGKLMVKLSLYIQILTFCSILVTVFVFYPVIYFYIDDPFVFIPFWILILYSAEVFLPIGAVLVSDSVAANAREQELDNGNWICLIFRAIAGYLTTGFIFWTQVNFCITLLCLPYVLILTFRSKLLGFVYLNDAPYQV